MITIMPIMAIIYMMPIIPIIYMISIMCHMKSPGKSILCAYSHAHPL